MEDKCKRTPLTQLYRVMNGVLTSWNVLRPLQNLI